MCVCVFVARQKDKLIEMSLGFPRPFFCDHITTAEVTGENWSFSQAIGHHEKRLGESACWCWIRDMEISHETLRLTIWLFNITMENRHFL